MAKNKVSYKKYTQVDDSRVEEAVISVSSTTEPVRYLSDILSNLITKLELGQKLLSVLDSNSIESLMAKVGIDPKSIFDGDGNRAKGDVN